LDLRYVKSTRCMRTFAFINCTGVHAHALCMFSTPVTCYRFGRSNTRDSSTATWTDRERHLHAVSLLLGPLTAEEEEARQALRSRKRKPDALSRGSSFSSSSAFSRHSVPPLSRQDTFDSSYTPSKLSRQSTFNTKSYPPQLSRQSTFGCTAPLSHQSTNLSRQNTSPDLLSTSTTDTMAVPLANAWG
jgi:hypothetical protein